MEQLERRLAAASCRADGPLTRPDCTKLGKWPQRMHPLPKPPSSSVSGLATLRGSRRFHFHLTASRRTAGGQRRLLVVWRRLRINGTVRVKEHADGDTAELELLGSGPRVGHVDVGTIDGEGAAAADGDDDDAF